MATQKKTIPEVLREIFQDNFGKKYHEYFIGDPIIIGKSYMPCLIISENKTRYELGATQHQTIFHEILIQVVYNKRDDFGKPAKEATLESRIQTDIQARDETTGDFLDTSIIGVLLRNITLNNLVIDIVPEVEVGNIPRSEQLTTVEGHIRCVIQEEQMIANRH